MNNLRLLKLFTANALSWESGYDYIFYALSKLVQSNMMIVLNIVGEGPLRAALLYSIEDLGLQKNITISPTAIPSLDADALLSSCNVYLNYSFIPGKQYYDEIAQVKGKYFITTDKCSKVLLPKMNIIKPRNIMHLVKTIEHIYWEVTNE